MRVRKVIIPVAENEVLGSKLAFIKTTKVFSVDHENLHNRLIECRGVPNMAETNLIG
jgi:hypothetical protein